MNKIGIFIPCYNVENSIRGVLNSFSQRTLQEVNQILAVDNCSKDRTFDILKEAKGLKETLGRKLVIIKNAENYGLGGSQKIAYQYFLDNGFTHFIIVHGDGQGDGEAIVRNFFKVFDQQPDIDVILASRFISGGDTSSYNHLRTVGNWVFNVITFVCTGYWMTDAGTAVIFYRTAILKDVPFADLTNSFQFNPELNILLHALKGVKIKEIPLSWKDSEDASNIRALDYCWTLLKILVGYRLNLTFLNKAGYKLFHSAPQTISPKIDVLK